MSISKFIAKLCKMSEGSRSKGFLLIELTASVAILSVVTLILFRYVVQIDQLRADSYHRLRVISHVSRLIEDSCGKKGVPVNLSKEVDGYKLQISYLPANEPRVAQLSGVSGQKNLEGFRKMRVVGRWQGADGQQRSFQVTTGVVTEEL